MSKRIGVLTSSRADFGIYLPLLQALNRDDIFELKIIAFGTHLSASHGYTVTEIEKEGFLPRFKIESMPISDSKEAVATSIGLTIMKFSSFWEKHGNSFDLVFCLGDRFEMFAAVMAGVPFQIKFAHIHGGEKTLGAIDNVFRHAISHASQLHFTATLEYQERVKQLIDAQTHIYYIGALSLDNLSSMSLLTMKEFKDKWGIDLNIKTILTTFHPETVNAEQNKYFAEEIVKAILSRREYQYLITMPNADTSGNTIRRIFEEKLKKIKGVYLVENLGTQGYFSAMKFCRLMVGNTSSGIIEAASFGKYVINLGNRQEGRACNENVINTPINLQAIQNSIEQFMDKEYKGNNIYYKAGAAKAIVAILKSEYFHEL